MALGGVGRTISIALSLATQGFNAGLNSASGSLNQFANTSRQTLSQVGTYAGVASAAITTGLAVSVAAAMNFEAAMSSVAAVSGATGAQFDRLRQQALDLGQSTQFSATEVAQAQAELLKAGVSTADVMGGALKGSLDLAAAAQIDVANAAEISAQMLNVFGLSGREASHVADVLAAAANKSAADVSDMALFFRQAGTAADLTGQSLEDTAAAAAIFANAGIKGSDAGTSLKTMLMNLTPATEKQAAAMDEYGLSFENADGSFQDLDQIAGQLRDRLSGLTDVQRAQALETIFGSDAIRAASLLYEQGADGVKYWAAQVDDSGYAAEVAAIKMDNLKGDLEKLRGSIETVLIQTGSEANGALRSMVQTSTDVVNAVGSLPAGFSQAGVGAAGLAVAVTAGVAGLGTFIPMARNVSDALAGMGGNWAKLSSSMTFANFTKIAAGAAVAAGAFTLFASQIEGAKRRGDELAQVFLAGLDQPMNFEQHIAYAQAVEEEITRLNGKLSESYNKTGADLGWFGEKIELAYERMNPFGSDTYGETMEAINRLVDEQQRAGAEGLAYAEIVRRLGVEMGFTIEQVEAFAEANGVDLAASAAQATGALAETGDAMEYADGQLRLTADAAANTDEMVSQLAPTLRAAKVEANALSPAAGELADAVQGSADAAADAEQRFEAFKRAVEATISIARDGPAAQRDFTRALWEARDAAKELNAETWHGFDANTEKAFAYQDAIDGLLNAYGEEITLARERGATQAEMDAIYQRAITSIVQMGDEGLLSAGEVQTLAWQLSSIPRNTDAYVAAHTGDAEAAVARLQARLASLHGTTTSFTVNGYQKVWGVAGFADGGVLTFADGGHTAQIARGGPTRIWNEPETGGEAYIPLAQSKRPRSVDVLRQTNALMGNPIGGAATINVTVAPSFPNYIGDKTDLARAVADPRVIDEITKGIRRSDASLVGARP